MNPLDNRYERNPALFRDMPENLFEDQGEIAVMFYDLNGDDYPCLLPYEISGNDFTVDCSKVKDAWFNGFEDDISTSINRKFGSFFLSRKDLNLNIIGL